MKTRKGAASIYIVLFTTTLLSIIALSFVRIMLSESIRTLNYSLSQSAYNSALAGIEDAKIVLLRYQNCIYNSAYLSNCEEYLSSFSSQMAAEDTAQDCDIVRKLLGYRAGENETLIQTNSSASGATKSAQDFDQAYTCVKVQSFTNDYIATLNDNNPTKIVPLRATDINSVNRISIQWFSTDDYRRVAPNGTLNNEWYGLSNLTGTLLTNKNAYTKDKDTFKNSFVPTPAGSADTYNGIVPPVLQTTNIQSGTSFTLDDFYVSDNSAKTTNRGTLMLRPTSTDIRSISAGATGSNHLERNVLVDSANKHFNTPIDVYCKLGEEGDWANGYSCMADYYLPAPIGGGARSNDTSFLVLNLPYAAPSTEVRVKMYNCPNDSIGIGVVEDGASCQTVQFANVQPVVDSTGRANDLFRRIEARVELVDTYFPIANYALAMTDPNNSNGIQKDFYVTQNCTYSTSSWDVSSQTIKATSDTCPNSYGYSGE